MTYPTAKFCGSVTDDEIHGYFDENKNRNCPKCTEKHIQERIKEAVSDEFQLTYYCNECHGGMCYARGKHVVPTHCITSSGSQPKWRPK